MILLPSVVKAFRHLWVTAILKWCDHKSSDWTAARQVEDKTQTQTLKLEGIPILSLKRELIEFGTTYDRMEW